MPGIPKAALPISFALDNVELSTGKHRLDPYLPFIGTNNKLDLVATKSSPFLQKFTIKSDYTLEFVVFLHLEGKK